MNIIDQLFYTPFRAKKSSRLYKELNRPNITKLFITKIDEDGDLGLGFKPKEHYMSWYRITDLELFHKKDNQQG